VLASLFKGLGAPFTLAQGAATTVAISSNFFLNNLLTYRDKRLMGGPLAHGLGHIQSCLRRGSGCQRWRRKLAVRKQGCVGPVSSCWNCRGSRLELWRVIHCHLAKDLIKALANSHAWIVWRPTRSGRIEPTAVSCAKCSSSCAASPVAGRYVPCAHTANSLR
jgi:hypothetical protein